MILVLWHENIDSRRLKQRLLYLQKKLRRENFEKIAKNTGKAVFA